MVGLFALWMPILVSAVFVFFALMIVHMLPGWHKDDMAAVPGEDKVMETLRGLNVPPGDYRFPFGRTVKEMTTPEFEAKMKAGPVGNMSILPSGNMNMGKLMGLWFVYSLVIAVIAAYVTGRTHEQGAPYLEVFRVSGAVTFSCYSMAHWQNWIWWGKGTRFTLSYTIDGLFYALVTAGTFGWLWPK
jgi:hypothetical protein